MFNFHYKKLEKQYISDLENRIPNKDFHEKLDLHVHVPEGATPKDGPSAGIGMCTALVSVLTGIPVLAEVAMTGEITLRGQILPIGGLKEKLLAAQRGGVKKVIIPEENESDLKEIPDNVKENLTILPVKWMDDVLEIALERLPVPLVHERAVAEKKKLGAERDVLPEVVPPEGEVPINPH